MECRSCGVKLARTRGVYIAIVVLAVAGCCLAVLLTRDRPFYVMLAAALVAVGVMTPVIKAVNYMLPLWRVANEMDAPQRQRR